MKMIIERIPVFFIGCVQSSEVALRALLARPEIAVFGVLTLRSSNYNSDFVDISGIASDFDVPVHYAEETDKQALTALLTKYGAKIVFTIGWSRLLEMDILGIPTHGVVGFHPAALPQNRGRHPLIWALALGLEKTASTLFVMDEGADSGPILSQKEVKITQKDDAKSLYEKVLAVLPEQIDGVVDQLVSGNLRAVPQDELKATTWRKRAALDGLIDWRMSAEAIFNLTRALTHPYVGADFRYGERLVKLWRCEIVTGSIPRNVEPGKILRIDASGPVIKTGMSAYGGAVRLLDIGDCPELHQGDYL
jgi:methionyl-tRNA formyltransferase